MYTGVDGETRHSIAFDHFIFFIQDVIRPQKDLDRLGYVIQDDRVEQSVIRECDPSCRPGGEIQVFSFSDVDQRKTDIPLSQEGIEDGCREFFLRPADKRTIRVKVSGFGSSVGGIQD